MFGQNHLPASDQLPAFVSYTNANFVLGLLDLFFGGMAAGRTASVSDETKTVVVVTANLVLDKSEAVRIAICIYLHHSAGFAECA